MRIKDASLWIFVLAVALPDCTSDPVSKGKVKLYVLDGGTIDVSDMRSFSSTDAFAGQQIQLANPSFLIRHPKGDLLWDTGHQDALADELGGTRFEEWHNRLETRLVDQLAQLELKPQDIEYLSLSHLHPDHSGNANLFSESIFLVHQLERQYMFSEEAEAIFGSTYAALEEAETLIFQDAHDVFGDSSVIIHPMPGHTPGSCVLEVRLQGAGNILLSGDLYIHAREREMQTVPTFNMDKPALLKSRELFEALAKRTNARVIIQHNKLDFEKLPRIPEFLD